MKIYNYKYKIILFTTIIIMFTCSMKNKYYFLELNKNLEIFTNVIKELNTYYVNEIDPNLTIRTGIRAILNSLDPYTNFITEQEGNYYTILTTGTYGGIGSLVGNRNNKNIIIMPYKGSPAHRQKLKIGDEIIKINKINIQEKSINYISDLLRGEPNSKIKLLIKRYGNSKPILISLSREQIAIKSIAYCGIIENDIGYIKLSEFTINASVELKYSLIKLKKLGMKKLILDLRGNPGGMLDEGVKISNLFIKEGLKIVETIGRFKHLNKIYNSNSITYDNKIPIIILINSGTASSSEIVAGAIQDHDRGILVGENTFGKGLVQITRPLGYSTYIKLTSAKYYTPSGRSVQSINYNNKKKKKLKKKFKTKNGRIIYNEKGINPDIKKNKFSFSPITISLFIKGLIFNYATIFYYNNNKINTAKKFKISDKEYNNFINWISKKDYYYIDKIEQIIDNLIKQAKNENYYINIKKQIYSIICTIQKNKEYDLKKFKKEIKWILKEEIASRYYLQEGAIEASFDYDKSIKTSVKIFKDINKYYRILQN